MKKILSFTNQDVEENFTRLKPSIFILPAFLILGIALFLLTQQAFQPEVYAEIQKDYFYSINGALAHFPSVEYNLTQLGNGLVTLSLLTVFVIYLPKMWEALISGSLFSLVVCSLLKNFFRVPRPAQIYDSHTFTIIGKTLRGYNSLPSGHTVTVFTAITVLLFALMPRKKLLQIFWIFLLLSAGLFTAFSRVAVGAHHPLDVVIGSILGYVMGLAGIFFSRRFTVLNWIGNRKSHLFFIILFTGCCLGLMYKTVDEQLAVYYFTDAVLVVSTFILVKKYVQK